MASGLWADEETAVARVKTYWKWYERETERFAGLSGLLKKYIRQQEKNAKNGGVAVEIYTSQIRTQISNWVEAGFLYEKPASKLVKETLADLGLRLKDGRWIKG